jgi:dTDP-4-amino-4,6-dideoxygalactose transaminase
MKPGRTLPPVGYRVPMGDVIRSAAGAVARRQGCTDALLGDMATALNVPHAYGVSSGKAALTTILRALHALTGRRKVILPAYTCYSVPSAIVKAGLEPVPVDIARDSFDYDYEQLGRVLDSDVLCALSVHLFGIPSETRRLADLCRRHGIYVVEDAAQAFGVVAEGRQLGTGGDVGFFSLGRGKNLTSGSGGIIVTASPQIADALKTLINQLPRPSLPQSLVNLSTLGVLSIFISPSMYWFPAGLPFLKLGETIFYDDFPVRSLSGFQARLLHDWKTKISALNAARLEAVTFYLHRIANAPRAAANVPCLRFPLLIDDPQERRTLLGDGVGRRFGISWMYPTSIGRIPQLAGRLTAYSFPRAEQVASSLVTLPTHPLLTRSDLERVVELVNRATAKSGRVPHSVEQRIV